MKIETSGVIHHYSANPGTCVRKTGRHLSTYSFTLHAGQPSRYASFMLAGIIHEVRSRQLQNV